MKAFITDTMAGQVSTRLCLPGFGVSGAGSTHLGAAGGVIRSEGGRAGGAPKTGTTGQNPGEPSPLLERGAACGQTVSGWLGYHGIMEAQSLVCISGSCLQAGLRPIDLMYVLLCAWKQAKAAGEWS